MRRITACHLEQVKDRGKSLASRCDFMDPNNGQRVVDMDMDMLISQSLMLKRK